jgi:hypothetical protein
MAASALVEERELAINPIIGTSVQHNNQVWHQHWYGKTIHILHITLRHFPCSHLPQVISNIRNLTASLFGVAAGTLGLESYPGFIFYLVGTLLVSTLLFAFKTDGKPSAYFYRPLGDMWLGDVFGGLSGFVLTWTLFYGLVRAWGLGKEPEVDLGGADMEKADRAVCSKSKGCLCFEVWIKESVAKYPQDSLMRRIVFGRASGFGLHHWRSHQMFGFWCLEYSGEASCPKGISVASRSHMQGRKTSTVSIYVWTSWRVMWSCLLWSKSKTSLRCNHTRLLSTFQFNRPTEHVINAQKTLSLLHTFVSMKGRQYLGGLQLEVVCAA